MRLAGLDPHEQIEALVVHVRKRMRRVDGQRGQDRVNLGVEIIVEISGLAGRQLLGRADANAVLDELGTDLGKPHLIHPGDEVVGAAGDFDQLGQGPRPSGGGSCGSRFS